MSGDGPTCRKVVKEAADANKARANYRTATKGDPRSPSLYSTLILHGSYQESRGGGGGKIRSPSSRGLTIKSLGRATHQGLIGPTPPFRSLLRYLVSQSASTEASPAP